jgi:predicted hotdog family 3-hydroxylacyl-ACP dehydratase
VSPYAAAWLAIDIAALVPTAALLAQREGRSTLELRVLLAAQSVVMAAAIVAAVTPLNAYAEWTLMVAANLGFALVSWRGGAVARSLATVAIVATTLSIALVMLKAFISIIAIAIGLVFALGALFAAALQLRQSRASA